MVIRGLSEGKTAIILEVWSLMSTVSIDLEEDLVALLRQSNQPVERAARELIVIELYRRGTISSGKAAQLLGMSRLEFIQFASRLGIPYFTMAEDEWKTERAQSERL
jgi:predicted HTH domain antitoxin